MSHIVLFAPIAVLVLVIVYQAVHSMAGWLQYRRSLGERCRPAVDDAKLPPVTILVPAHNEEMVIENTVNSLLAQDYPADKLSVLVINDASTDGTAAILDRLDEVNPRVRILHRQAPEGGKGKSAALNAALHSVAGEYVAIFDADNRPEPRAVRMLVETLLGRPELAAAVGKFRTGNKRVNLLTRMINIEGLLFQNIVQAGRWFMFGIAALTGTNYMIRKSVLAEVGGWDEKALTEDTELSVRLYQAGYQVAYVMHASSWEQEPETARVWMKQRTRWARGNNYAIVKLVRTFPQARHKAASVEILSTLLVPFVVLAGVLMSHVGAIMVAFSALAPGHPHVFSHLWLVALLLFSLVMILALSYDGELSWSNLAVGVLMYFTYGYAWMIVLIRALYIDCVRHEAVHWDKTVRFDSEIVVETGRV